ncbi:MAG: hypothetical protein V1734_06405 [Nanoarchaeota archaeon]
MMNISAYALPSLAVLIFAIAIILFSMTERRTYYRRVITACLALVLVPLAYILNEYLAYALQALVLIAVGNVCRHYYKAGYFRRRKELMEIFRHDHPEHRDAKKMLYHSLKDMHSREKTIEKRLAEIEETENKLREKEFELKEQARALKEKQQEAASVQPAQPAKKEAASPRSKSSSEKGAKQ